MGTSSARLILSAGLFAVTFFNAAQARDDENPPAELRQPGDDIARDAKPVQKIDEKTTESLAWYMSGIAAQRNNDIAGAIEAFGQASLADPKAPEPVRAHALLLLRTGQIGQGMALARSAIRLDPGDYHTRFQLASILLRQPSERNVNEAVDLMDAALGSDRIDRTNEEFLLIHSVRGRVLLQLGKQKEAADSYEVLLQALERPEDFALDFRRHQALVKDQLTGYETVGNAMLAVGRTDKAIQAFEALVRLNQDQPGRHHLLLAAGLFQADRVDEAEKSLNAYLASGQRDAESLQLLTRIYSTTSRSSQIIERLTELLENSDGDTSVIQLYLANTQLQQGQFDEAVESYERVILDTGDPAAYLGLIRVDIVRANAESFIRTLQKALRARVSVEELDALRSEIIGSPEFAEAVLSACDEAIKDDSVTVFPEVTWLCSQIAKGIENSDAEARLLKATLSLNPNQKIGIEALEQLAMYHLLQDEYKESAQLFRRLQSLPGLDHGRKVVTLLRLSIAESMNDEHQRAVAAIRAAMDMEPNHPELTYRLGWIQYRANELSAAEQTLNTALELTAGNPPGGNDARMLLAVVYSQTQRFDQSIQEYESVIEHSGDDPETQRRARMSLSAVHVEMGDSSKAERILEELYKEQPDDPGVNNDLGYLYADQNKNLNQALDMIQLAVDASPENQAYLDSLGWVLYRLERHEEALEALKKANSDPDFQDATLQEHLADVYKALGQDDEAKATWKKALETEQSSEHPDEDVIARLKSRLETPASSNPDSTPDSPPEADPETAPEE